MSETQSTPTDVFSDSQQSFPSPQPTGSPPEPCPLAKSITGSFDLAEVKCGSPVHVQADATNISDGTSASFNLRKLASKSSIQTLSAPLASHQVRNKEWVSKKPSSFLWNGKIDFRVSAGGVSADSTNQLKIHHYDDIANETRSANLTSGIYGWRKAYDIEFKNGLIKLLVKIKLLNMLGPRPAKDSGDPMPAVGSPVSGIRKALMAKEIQGYLSRKWNLHRAQCQRHAGCGCPTSRQCCKFKVKIQIKFVESGEHHTVQLFQGPGGANSSQWFREKTRANTYGHEVGHLLGFFDEYAGGAIGAAPWQIQDGVLMNTGAKIPEYYYGDFSDWFAAKTGENWDRIAP